MPEPTLRDCRILVVEDEYMLADDLTNELVDAQAIVIGPVATVGAALELLAAEQQLDGAILDVNLCGEMVFPVADQLLDRRVPFLFSTGYDGSIIPPRFAHVVRCEKPIDMKRVTLAIGRVVHS